MVPQRDERERWICLTSNRCIPGENTLGWSAVVFCGDELIPFSVIPFSVVFSCSELCTTGSLSTEPNRTEPLTSTISGKWKGPLFLTWSVRFQCLTQAKGTPSRLSLTKCYAWIITSTSFTKFTDYTILCLSQITDWYMCNAFDIWIQDTKCSTWQAYFTISKVVPQEDVRFRTSLSTTAN